jgi:hypothetical protein
MNRVRALIAAAGAVLAFLLGFFLRDKPGRMTAVVDGKKLEEVKREIENTPAPDLVDAAPDAAKLHADAAGIAGKFRQRLRDRSGRILSGNPGTGPDGTG